MILKFFKKSTSRLKGALKKTRNLLGSKIAALFGGGLSEGTIDNLEQLLYEADLGVTTAMELTEKMRALYKENPSIGSNGLIDALKKELLLILSQEPATLATATEGPTVILIVGVNGNGKTTSIAKIAKQLKSEGKKVILGAADTFRAAAVEQLNTWAQRADVAIVKGQPKADPAAVAFDTVSAAVSREMDFALIDTAGRLQTKTDLMKELEKIKRSCTKVLAGAPHETLLVLDATTGQNAIDQAKTFGQYANITGLVLTKLDGSAKGGIAVAIQKQLGIPIKFIGVGEGIDDLMPFDAIEYVDSLLG